MTSDGDRAEFEKLAIRYLEKVAERNAAFYTLQDEKYKRLGACHNDKEREAIEQEFAAKEKELDSCFDEFGASPLGARAGPQPSSPVYLSCWPIMRGLMKALHAVTRAPDRCET